MKKYLLISFCLLCIVGLQAQNTQNTQNTQTKKQAPKKAKEKVKFERKGKILIETGYNLAAGVSKGTGINVLAGQDETVTSIGIDGGYFVSNRLAIKFALGVYASSLSISNFSIGPKYYIIDKIPVELNFGLQNVSGRANAQLNFNVGYAINLADNITLEPKVGILGSNGANLIFSTKFAMFL